MVGGAPDVTHPGVGRARIAINDDPRLQHMVVEPPRHVNIVYARLRSASDLEITRQPFVHEIDERRVFDQPPMDGVARRIERKIVHPAIDRRAGIVVARNHPELVRCVRHREKRPFENGFYLVAPRQVSAEFRRAGLALRVRLAAVSPRRPVEVDGHDVHDVRTHPDPRPSRSGRDEILGDALDREARRDALHVALRTLRADPDVLVSVPRGEFRPALRENPLRFVFDMIRRAGLPLGLDLREDADVGRLLLHPFDETVEVVGLPVPHG